MPFMNLGEQAIKNTISRKWEAFLFPFSGVSILFKKPMKKPPNLFSFLSPLSLDVWIYMATAYLGVSVLLFILARYL